VRSYAPREPDTHRGDGDPAAVEDLEELPEALPTGPEEILLRTAQSSNESSRVSDARQPSFFIGDDTT
jgi:hypothetical protein